jgi:hypothetical protein
MRRSQRLRRGGVGETEKGDASTPKAHLNPYIPIFHVDVICGISP